MRVRRKVVVRHYNELKRRVKTNIERNLDAGATFMMDDAPDAKETQLVDFLIAKTTGTFFLGFDSMGRAKTGPTAGAAHH